MNNALTTNLSWEGSELLLARANYKLLQIALVAAGYSADRYAVLEPECRTNLVVVERRKDEWTEFYLNALALNADLTTLPNIQECDLISADDSIIKVETRTYASLTTALTGANNDIKYTAREIGVLGNIIQVQYVDPGGNNAALAVTVVGTLIRVALATGSGGAITSTATLIRAAVSANTQANSLVSNALVASNTGAGVVTAMAATNLSGGTGLVL